MAYPWIKALHIVFIASWFAGLFYLPRIFVNLAMETEPAAKERLLLMARKLYRFMTILMIPALIYQAIITVMVATAMVVKAPMIARLGAVLFMISDTLIAIAKFTDVGVPPGSVLQAWTPAWTLNGRLLKPAMVVVAGK